MAKKLISKLAPLLICGPGIVAGLFGVERGMSLMNLDNNPQEVRLFYNVSKNLKTKPARPESGLVKHHYDNLQREYETMLLDGHIQQEIANYQSNKKYGAAYLIGGAIIFTATLGGAVVAAKINN